MMTGLGTIAIDLSPEAAFHGLCAEITIPSVPAERILKNVRIMLPALTEKGIIRLWDAVRCREEPGLISHLLQLGVPLKQENNCVVIEAVWWGQYEMAKAFVENGVNPNFYDNDRCGSNTSALMAAVVKDKLDIVRFIAEAVQSRNDMPNDLQHAFHIALYQGRDEISSYLKDTFDLRMDVPDQYGQTAMEYLMDAEE